MFRLSNISLRRAFQLSILVAIAILACFSTLQANEITAQRSNRDVDALLKSTKYVRELDEARVIELVPLQSGLHYIDCPNCDQGKQEGQLTWSIDSPNEVVCEFCKHRYPSEKYPMSDNVTVQSPLGRTAHFPYWKNEQGYRHFFQAKRDDEIRIYLAQQARDLAALYVATKDKQYARRSAVIVDRFAELFPNWCYHYDYPFQQKEIYDGNVAPNRFRSGYRTARWTWWAYLDIPLPLILAYDGIRESGVLSELSQERGVDVAARIERDLIRNACDQVMANQDLLTNMSPSAWRSLIQAGKVIKEPYYVHEPVRRLGRFVETQFFYDGMWSEGSPDYGSQTMGGLSQVLQALQGYSDPPGYVDPIDASRFDNLELSTSFPSLNQAREVLSKMRLPNGRSVPVHDTWSTSKRGTTEQTKPYLLPALGHACLGGGNGDTQTQFHLTWSGGYGHSHGDNLSLLLFANGQESLSDLGYTHTAYRAWTLATAAHNTVVIDGKNQELGGIKSPTDGQLMFYDATDPRVQIVSATGERGYPGLAKNYSRTLVVVDMGEGRRYAIDVFDVEGGQTHDYLLHGDADRDAIVRSELKLKPIKTLLPPNMKWTPTRNEGETGRIAEQHYAYGFLSELSGCDLKANQVVPITFGSADATGPKLLVTLLTENDSELIIGKNPSIRRALENDGKLDQFQRPFMMLRHQATQSRSRFVSVLEPYVDTPFIKSIERLPAPKGTIAIQVRSDERTDLIVLSAQAESVTLRVGTQNAIFSGEYGVLSLSNDSVKREVKYAYAVGKGGWKFGDFEMQPAAACKSPLRAVEAGVLIVDSKDTVAPEPGSIVRIITDDGWVYPFSIQQSTRVGEQLRLNVVEATSMHYDEIAKRLKLVSFPQREHVGSVNVQWSPRTSRSQ